MPSPDIESIRAQTRDFLGTDVDLDYITADYVQEALVGARDADDPDLAAAGRAESDEGTIYGLNFFTIDGTAYWQADDDIKIFRSRHVKRGSPENVPGESATRYRIERGATPARSHQTGPA